MAEFRKSGRNSMAGDTKSVKEALSFIRQLHFREDNLDRDRAAPSDKDIDEDDE